MTIYTLFFLYTVPYQNYLDKMVSCLFIHMKLGLGSREREREDALNRFN